MSEDRTRQRTARSGPTALSGRLDLVAVVLRAVAALLLVPSSVLKIVDYGGQAAFFAEIGIPAPGVTVLLVAGLELGAAVLMATGVEARVGALATVPVMLTAIGLAGPMVSNLTVLVACVGIVGLGAGRYTLRESDPDLLQRVAGTVR